MARPTKLTPEVQANIVKMIAGGVHPRTACAIEGIGAVTFWEWKKRGAAGEAPYQEFYEEVEKAEALILGAVEREIVKATKRDWRAGAFVMQKRSPNVYGERATLEISGPRGGPILLTDDAADLIARKILHGERDGLPENAEGGEPDEP